MFVSSTLEELAPERAAVKAAIERLHLIPVMFEMGARPHPPRNLYRSYLRQSQVFVGLYWQKYGWVAPEEEISGLEDEYRLSNGMPRLLYMKKPADREARLRDLIAQIQADDTASYRSFDTAEELGRLIEEDLMVLLTERFAAPEAEQGPASRIVRPPIPINPIVGRADEVALVKDAILKGSRLVTITGTGGMGKSRLALEVAQLLEKEFSDGIVFVPLEPLFQASQVPRAMAESFGLRMEYAEVTLDAVTEYLQDKHMLLILDNFEHVIDAAAEMARLIDSCDRVQALVTSRRPLRVRGEREIPIGPLADEAAVQLFTERARAVRPDFVVSADEQMQLTELIKRLDHLPLAIELAAARMRLLDVPELLTRLGERMEVLGSAPVNYPDRQRTLRTTIAWSYNLLSEVERLVLSRISVFAGGADLDAIEALCSDAGIDVLEVVDSLLENSLILRTQSSPSGEARFAMLNTIKTYAREQLEQQPDCESTYRRHVDWFLRLCQRADFSRSNEAIEVWPLLDFELANLAVAIRWCLDHADLALIAAFARPIWFWLWQTGRLKDAQPAFEEAVALISPDTPRPIRAEVLVTVSTVRFFTGDYLGAEKLLDEAMPIVEELEDDTLLIVGLLTRASAQPHLGRMSEAAEMAARALDLARRTDTLSGVGFGAAILGFLRALEGDLATGRALSEEVVAIGERIRLDGLRIQGWLNLAVIDVMESKPEDARQHLWLAKEVVKYFEDREGAALALEVATTLALNRSEFVTAARTQASAEALRNSIGMPIWPLMDLLKQANVAQLRMQLGDTKYEEIVKEAQTADHWMILDAAVGPSLPDPEAIEVDLSSAQLSKDLGES